MSDSALPDPNQSPDVSESSTRRLDVGPIRDLIRLMHRFDLSAIDISDGDLKVRLRRGSLAQPVQAPPAPAYPAPVAVAPVASGMTSSPVTSSPSDSTSSESASTAIHIESELVGTYYSASDPKAPPFVKVGSTIQSDTTVGIIEAMKVFNEIKAGGGANVKKIPPGQNFRIAEILVENGEAVEFGQPLFRIEPA